MLRRLRGLCWLSVLAAAPLPAQPGGEALEEIIVTAQFRRQRARELPASVSVLDHATLEDAGLQHFEDVLLLVPNLNWSGETSRPRFLQLRGIGEREQYQGAPNPSVGFLVDDIDFSGIGMVATLFDVEQIEVLRGPQGTRYGANALAGLVNVKTRDPGDDFDFRARLLAGDDATLGAGLAFGGPLGENWAYRLVTEQFSSDGFRDNVFLGRSDTNQRDELTIRAKLRWEPGADWKIDLTSMSVDLNNGYDAWAIDNTFTTRSDKPGKDSQQSNAAAARIAWQGNDRFHIHSITTIADSDIQVSFDGDWGNNADWGTVYDFVSDTLRERKTRSQELRFLSAPGANIWGGTTSWLAGVYALRLEENNRNFDLFNDFVFRDLQSDYEATNTAAFGQLDVALGPRTNLSAGIRIEHRDARYSDTAAVGFSPDETMFGGHLSLSHAINQNLNAYAALVRGYKAGGFNIGNVVPADRRQFDAEFLWSLESGIKGGWLDGALTANIGLFYSWREDQQVSTSVQLDPNDPLTFIFLTDNAANGFNYGLEADLAWQFSARWRLLGTLGLLETEYQDFDSPTLALSGREQAHAPGYQFSLGVEYRDPRGYFARIDLLGRDDFFFDDSHNQKSQAYELVNLRIGYESEHWSVSLWGRNLFDERYSVRGFFFGNEPPDFLPTRYTRQGDPRQVGVTATFAF